MAESAQFPNTSMRGNRCSSIPTELSPTLADLAGAVRRIRQSDGLSQQDAAYRGDLDRGHFAQIERGEKNVRFKTLVILATSLQRTPTALILAAEQLARYRDDLGAGPAAGLAPDWTPPTALALARTLRRLRVGVKASTTELAASTGVSFGAISAIERGLREPMWRTMCALSVGLDLRLWEFATAVEQDHATGDRAQTQTTDAPTPPIRVAVGSDRGEESTCQ
jgi:transcriptional regulator with XRE-family HTH domain